MKLDISDDEIQPLIKINDDIKVLEQEIVEDQEYYKRDENGYQGMTKYPWSAKLNTIEMGKVAFDVFEMKRH